MPFPFNELIERLTAFYESDIPVISRIAAGKRDPFLVLIGCLLEPENKGRDNGKGHGAADGAGPDAG